MRRTIGVGVGLLCVAACGGGGSTAPSDIIPLNTLPRITLPRIPPPTMPGWNLPRGWTVICQTGRVTSRSPGFAMPAGGTINFGGPVPCTWNRNGGQGSIGLASAATNPNGTRNTDIQPSGYRVTFPAGKVNDPAWDMYLTHTGGTGSYYVGWRQRWQPVGTYAAIVAAMHSSDSKVWAPKGPSDGDLTIMSWLAFNHTPVIGLDFQGVDEHSIPDNNETGAHGTIPVTRAMTLPGVAVGRGAWDQEEILIKSTGVTGTSSVTLFVNGKNVGTATGVTNATAWTASEQYLSRSVYGGAQAKSTHTDIDDVTIAVH